MFRRMIMMFVFVALLALVGCGSSEYIDENPRELLPIVEGNYWVVNSYGNTELDTLKYIPMDWVGPDEEDGWFGIYWSNNFDKYFMRAKLTTLGLVHTFDTTKGNSLNYQGQEIKSQYQSRTFKGVEDNYLDNDRTFLYAKYPVARGDKWTVMENVGNGQTENGTSTSSWYMECISRSQRITTPAGSFNCIVYSESIEFDNPPDDYETFTRHYYWAPGIGLILIQYSDEEHGVITEYELVDYHIQ